MEKRPLGRTGIEVSVLCLGSMTWGTQNTEAEGHAQIDRALAAGVNFIDTAEMYPTNPVSAETAGRTEEIIGSWIAQSGRRDEVVLATKVTGPSTNPAFIRGGEGYDGRILTRTVEESLRRLRTDVIDLYQLHWPVRGSYHFRQNWGYDPSGQDRAATVAHMIDVLETMRGLVEAGKVRHFGLSNETTWGTMMWLALAEAHGLPRVASIQNEYSLLARLYDSDLAELCVNEDVGLLSFSPMGAGLLSGKYASEVTPAGTRRSITPDLGGRITPRVWPAIEAYRGIAERHGLDPSQMALAWTLTRPGLCSSIFGATSMEQLETALGAADLTLSDEVLDEIAAAHRAHPLPY
jgi:aryl-alcohol dehydrogenase-like predicted oxidoreductase